MKEKRVLKKIVHKLWTVNDIKFNQAKNAARILALTMILALGLTGCTTYNNFKNAWLPKDKVEEERTIKIGVFEPMSGQYKQQGMEEVRGIELAYEKMSKVLDKKIQLVYGDNKSNMYDGETALEELMSNSPNVVLGSYGEVLTLTASDYIKSRDVPGIAISSRNPLITGNNPYYFTVSFSETKQGNALADFAYNSMKKDIGATVRFENDDRAQAIDKRFNSRFRKLTENPDAIVGSFQVKAEETDFSVTIEKIRNSGAKVVLLAMSPVGAELFLKQCVEKNMTHILFLGTDEWNDSAFLDKIRNSDKLSIAYVAHEPTVEKSFEAKEFIDAYKKKYGANTEPTLNTALAYDAYMLALQAMENAYVNAAGKKPADIDKEAETVAIATALKKEIQTIKDTGIPTGRFIRDALSQIENYKGVSGIINYKGSNEPSKTIDIASIIKGKDGSLFTSNS